MELRPADLTYSVRRYYVDAFLSRQVGFLPRGSRLIDVGGHKAARRGQFDIGQHDLTVIYVNLATGHGCDVQADAAALPLRTESFDVAICSELVEHVPDPYAVVREVSRVLRRGGILLVCAPFLFRIHDDPRDYGRYTDCYWQQCLTSIGFRDVVIEPQGMFWAVIADFLKQYANQLDLSGWHGRTLKIVARRLVSALVSWAVAHERTHAFTAIPSCAASQRVSV